MKALLTLIFGIGLGIGLAYGFFRLQASSIPETFPADGWPDTGKSIAPECDMVLPGSPTVDFGNIISGKTYEREVFVENVGQADGEIWINGQPPESLKVDLIPEKHELIASRSRLPISIRVVAPFGEDKFSKKLIIQTSNGTRRLVIDFKGNVTPGIAIFPQIISVSKTDWESKNPFEINVATWLNNELTIKSTLISPDPNLCSIEVLPLTDAAKTRYPSIRSGKTLRITPTGSLPVDLKKVVLSVDTGIEGFAILDAKIEISQ